MATLRELLAMQEEGGGRKPRRRSNYDEHNLQASEVRYIRGVHPDLSGVFLCVPNGQKRTSRQTAWLKEEGLLPGASDMLLLKSTSQYGFLCIENKTPKGRQSPEQKVFQKEAERHGGKYIVVRSLDEFIKAITDYLNGEL